MQSQTSLKVFKFLAGFISAYHFILALIGIFGSSNLITRVINSVYGVFPEINNQFLYLAKFISAYMIVFSIAMALLAWKPVQYRNLVWLPITLFGIRIIQRLVFFDLINETFQTTAARNLQVIIPIAVLLVALLYFRPREYSTATS
ncbi:MAG: hypothetical protein WAV15_03700 [Minisyncoccia bacterium]